MRLVFGKDDTVANWALRRLKRMGEMHRGFIPPYTAIGIESAGRLTGAYVFNNYRGPDVEITVAGRGAFCRTAFKAVEDYVYNKLGCVRMTAIIRADNDLSFSVACRYGFRFEGCSKKKFGDCDGIILGLLKEESHYERNVL